MMRVGLPPQSMKMAASQVAVPRFFQFAVLAFVLATGAMPTILQGIVNGFTGAPGAYAAAIASGLAFDLLRVAPLIVLARHPLGVLHPIVLAIVLWPVLTVLPQTIDQLGGYAGLLSGDQLRPPVFRALAWRGDTQAWLDVARYNLFQILALLATFAGYALSTAHSGKPIPFLSDVDTRRVRSVLIGIALMNFFAVAIFIQFRGGLAQHITALAFGRFRALEGLGPIIALFDLGYIALLIWVCVRPQDARQPVFLSLLVLVAAQQFLTAGSRSAAITVIVITGLGWALAQRRIPWRIALLALPAILLSFGVLNVIRASGLSGNGAVSAVQDRTVSDVIAVARDEFEIRQAVAGSIPVTADAMATTGMMLGRTYQGAIFALVPRALWPDKPRGPGSMYAQTFLGESREGTAVPISPVAEAYWNFHIPGIIVLFALYGLLLRRAQEFYLANLHNGFAIAVFALFVTQFGMATDRLVAFQQTLIALAIIWVMLMVFGPRARRIGRAPALQA
ncbi:O-antigen polymerase [Qipengyuania sp. YIM B01966]|uniref:O-antigen polymerase n=1 Tax=Qipengyuania sp. YIM B01966 TaxID=2778646 RepID=UPI0018F6CB78|nr:O-antigen polymerase [Qipengyuania sp. YIM B01966]